MAYLREFADYVDSGNYLPGELSRMGLTSYNPYDPIAVSQTISKARFKFQPKTNNTGQSFQEFFNTQINPNSLLTNAIAPGIAGFNQVASMFSQQ